MSLFRSIATVGGYTMLSRVLGFARDILVAAILGAGPIADAFFIAFKLPNLFRRLFAEGAFNAAFVPLFAQKLEDGEDGHAKAHAFALQAFSFLFFILALLTAIFEISMPWVMRAFAPGFVDDPQKFDLAVTFTRITFPYLLFIALVSLMAGVMNSLGKFAAAAATPVLLNICLIIAIVAATPYMESPGHALSWGVFFAGIVQFIWLLINCRRQGMAMRLGRFIWNKDLKTLVQKIVPGAIGAGIYQVNLVVDMIIASMLPTGSISYLFFADRINQLPLGVVGVAVGTALLPLLSRQLRAGDQTGAMNSLNRALEFTLFLTLPAAVAIAVLPDTIVVILFQRAQFDATAASATAAALMVYAFGLPAYVLNKALTPGFFARSDTKTPMIIGGICMIVNVVLNLLLMGPFLHVGLAMATVISAWTNTALLAIVLKKRDQIALDHKFMTKTPRIIASAAVMGGVLYGSQILLSPWLHAGETVRILALSAIVLGGLGIYFAASHISGALRLGELKSMMRRGKS